MSSQGSGESHLSGGSHGRRESHESGAIGVTVSEERLKGHQWVYRKPRLYWRWNARFTLTRELDGTVLQSVTATNVDDAIQALLLLLEDETVKWVCTCWCEEDTDALIHEALAGTRFSEREPTH